MSGLFIPVARPQDVGPALRLIRTELGLGQKFVAARARMSASYLAQTELSRHGYAPTTSLAVNVLHVLGHQLVIVPADRILDVLELSHG